MKAMFTSLSLSLALPVGVSPAFAVKKVRHQSIRSTGSGSDC
jgi:hypothetical protein